MAWFWLLAVWSRPARARGLKQNILKNYLQFKVAPRAGAWIETNGTLQTKNFTCRAPRGRVD